MARTMIVEGQRPQRHTIRGIQGPDHIGLAGFNDRGFVIAQPAEPHSPQLLGQSQRLRLYVGGHTNITDGLRVGIEMLENTPRGMLRRIWLLSDGAANRGIDRLWDTTQSARNAYININTIGFGDQYNEALLRGISAATHRGRFMCVTSLRELTDALVQYGNNGNNGRSQHTPHSRAETTVLVLDLSGSMEGPMEGTTKVRVVEEAVLHLLHYKQQLFS